MKDWLTDDNIEYILKNSTPIQTALVGKNIKIFDNIANTYLAFKVAQKGNNANISEIEQLTLFKQDFSLLKKEINLLPIRVSGNHWGLIIIEDKGISVQVHYTSSSGAVDSEKEQVKPLIFFLTNNTTGNSIQTLNGAKQNNGNDCGVYLIKYIEEILETNSISLNRTYSDIDITNFRGEWKAKIGDKWCDSTTYDTKGDDWAKLGIIGEKEIKKWFDENAPIGEKGFTFLDTEKLIQFGFKPHEADFAKWLKNKLEKEGKDISDIDKFLNNISDLEVVRKDYQSKIDPEIKKESTPKKQPDKAKKEEQPTPSPIYSTNNCWLHNFSYSGWGENEGKTLEEKPVVIKSDYQNNLKIIFSPNKKELDQEQLLKDIDSWKLVYELEKDKNNELSNKIQDKEQRILALRSDRDDLINKLDEKTDRIDQLDQTLKGSALIFQKQINAIDQTKKALEKEQAKSGASKEFIEHLKIDIQRLDNEKTELEIKITDLKEEESKNKEIRDKELTDLRNQLVVKNAEIVLAHGKLQSLIHDISTLLLPGLTNKVIAEAGNDIVLREQVKEVMAKLPPEKGWDDTTTSLTITEANKNEYLTDIKWGLARFRKLTTLNCSNTQITSLPALPSSLINLHCYNTQITSLPTLPNSLTTLQCFNIKNADIGFIGGKFGGAVIPGRGLKQAYGNRITNITFQPRTAPINYIGLNDNRYSQIKVKITDLTNYWQGTGFLATIKPYLFNENDVNDRDQSKTFLEWHKEGNSYL